jgi:hypothetical protein
LVKFYDGCLATLSFVYILLHIVKKILKDKNKYFKFDILKFLSKMSLDYLPGTASLLEEIDKKLMVLLRDGRTLIGYLRSQ